MHQSNKTIDTTDSEVVVIDVVTFLDSKTKEKNYYLVTVRKR